jgi:hypothetical protein
MPKRSPATRSPPPRPKRKTARPSKFINVAVSEKTRTGLNVLKTHMKAPNQAAVIARLVEIGVAIYPVSARTRAG